MAKAPQFAKAWASLALANDAIYWYEPMDHAQAQAYIEKAAAAARQAQLLAPDSAETEHVLGNVARENFEYASAEQHYLRGIAIDPSYPDVREDYSELLLMVGRVRDSMAAARELVKLDPYFVVGWMRRYSAATAVDDRAVVEMSLRRLRALDPKNFNALFGALDYALSYSRIEEARRAAAEIEAHYPEQGKLVKVLVPWALREGSVDDTTAHAALKALPAAEIPGYIVARQDVAGFLEYFSNAGPMDQTYFFSEMYTRPSTGRPMLRDQRIKAKLTEYGFVAYWRAKGWPPGCKAVGEDDFDCAPGAGEANVAGTKRIPAAQPAQGVLPKSPH